MGTPDSAVFEEDAAEQTVTLHKGPYGYYVQLGEAAEGQKPPRASIPKGMDPATLALERALDLLSLPRQIGTHPEDGQPVEAGHRPLRALREARQDLRQHPRPRRGLHHRHEPRDGTHCAEIATRRARRRVKPLRELGAHPDGGTVAVYSGRYGPYVKWEKVNATLPEAIAPEAVTLEQALELIAAKKPAGKKRRRRRRSRPRASPPRPPRRDARPPRRDEIARPPPVYASTSSFRR